MIWFIVLLGAVIGMVLESLQMLGFWFGLVVALLLVKVHELRVSLKTAQKDLAELEAWRWRQEEAAREDSTPNVPVPMAKNEQPAAELTATPPAPAALNQTVAAEDPATPAAPPDPVAVETPLPASPEPLEPPPEPALVDRGLEAIKRWFTEGNVPVKIGVLVLFAGVAAALRFAAAEGYFTVPIGLRLTLIALAALAGLGLGWRERERRVVFGLSLQGGAIGVLLLTIFAAFRLYGLLPTSLAFALVVVLVGGAALLAVLQQAMVLAVLGFLGGYLAPVLLSTGGGNHLALFSYYAVLNVAVLAISWRQHWRVLNLIGFAFTFGVGAVWFSNSYQPELFWTVEPFLILFFLFYVLIGLLYAARQDTSLPSTSRPSTSRPSTSRQPWLDGTLVFGTPLVAFPMQAVLLRDQPMVLAFSAITVAGLYLGLLYGLRERRQAKLLTEAYAALALAFATLAVPLAFSAATTASLWALEGAAVAWMGVRQGRKLPWISGLALQLFAAGAYLISEIDRSGHHDWLLLNSTWLGAAMLGFAGLALALIHDRYKPIPVLPALLMSWGLAWWTAAGLTQIDETRRHFGGDGTGGEGAEWLFAMAYLSLSLLAAGGLRRWLVWPRSGWGMALWALFILPCIPWAHEAFDQVLALPSLPAWVGYLSVWLVALWLNREGPGRSVALTHGLGLWTVLLAVTSHIGGTLEAASGWTFLAMIAPLGLLTLGLWRRSQWLAWPRADAFNSSYPGLWFGLALPLLALSWLAGLFDPGPAEPLPFLPLLNPLELGLMGIGVLMWAYCRDRLPQIAEVTPLWAAATFAFFSSATLRAVHQLHGDVWSYRLFDSGFAQTSLTVVWSLLGVTAWVAGSRLHRRTLWLAGAGLMGVVLLKLILIDRQYMGNIPGIVSFMAVGLLLVAVGYFAPSPPNTEELS